jgi:ATP-dependent RNA helicase RhlE
LLAIREEGYIHPTPIQEEAVRHLIDGRDLLGCAQTGTGKTAAFALPILQRLYAGAGAARRRIRALIVTPTRELAQQNGESFDAYGRHTGLRNVVVHGGVRQAPQVARIRRGVDILVATPGRLLDLMGQDIVHLDAVEVLVLDEADRMFDMGFIMDIRRIVAAVPRQRQTMLFSATMPQSIMHLAQSILSDPVEIRIAPEAPEPDTVDQLVYLVEPHHKQALLHHLLDSPDVSRALVFTRTRKGADRVLLHLQSMKIDAEAIHSDRPQNIRQRVLAAFKEGRLRVLVASDIASRGLDVEDISHVVNFDMPQDAETYVHRIGRTGRAGQRGCAFSFCGLGERAQLREIEGLLGHEIPTMAEHPFLSHVPRLARHKPVTPAAVPGQPPPRRMGHTRTPSKRRR